MDITLQEAEACIQELPARSLHQLPQDLQRDRGRPIPHVSWEAEINEPAGAPTALVLSAQFWRMQSRKQWPPHTNSHYVIPQCDGLTCFQNGQIRGLQTYTCSRKPSAPILDLDPRDISFLDSRHSPTLSSPRASSRAFCHPLT